MFGVIISRMSVSSVLIVLYSCFCNIHLYEAQIIGYNRNPLVPTMNLTTCATVLSDADYDGDEKLNANEFLSLLQRISCFRPVELNWDQWLAYTRLACLCHRTTTKEDIGDDTTSTDPDDCCLRFTDGEMAVNVSGIVGGDIFGGGGDGDPMNLREMFTFSLVCDTALEVVEGGYIRPEILDGDNNKTECPPTSSPTASPTKYPTVQPTTDRPISTAKPTTVRPSTLLQPTVVPTLPQVLLRLEPTYKPTQSTPPTVDFVINPKEAGIPSMNPILLALEPTMTPIDPTTTKPILLSLESASPTVELIVNPKEATSPPSMKPLSLVLDTMSPTVDLIIHPKAPSTPQPDPVPVPVPVPVPSNNNSPAPTVARTPCIKAIIEADIDNDESLSPEEFITFISIMYCPGSTQLTLIQEATFHVLRCLCVLDPPYLQACCINEDKIKVTGIKNTNRTPAESGRISRVCAFNQNLTGCVEPNPITTTTTATPVITSPSIPAPAPAPAPAPLTNAPVWIGTSAPTTRTTRCTDALVVADENNDQYLNIDEYLLFVQRLEPPSRSCTSATTTLTSIQTAAFYGQACICIIFPDCCSETNAKISIDGANLPVPDRTFQQSASLDVICVLLDLDCTTTISAPSSSSNNPVEVPPAAQPPTSSQGTVRTNSPIESTINTVQPIPSPTNGNTAPVPSNFVDPVPIPSTQGTPSVPYYNENGSIGDCEMMLVQADQNNDNLLDIDEYLSLIKDWSNCDAITTLSNEQKSTFVTLACECLQRNPSSSSDCCAGSNGRIFMDGARVPITDRTSYQQTTITNVCTMVAVTVQQRDYCYPAPIPTPTQGLSSVAPTPVIVTCSDTLVSSDTDSDTFINYNEFRGLLMKYSGCDTTLLEYLGDTIDTTFYKLACKCHELENASKNCCLPRNARIDSTGAEISSDLRTVSQTKKLNTVCDTVNSILPQECPVIGQEPTFVSTPNPVQTPLLEQPMVIRSSLPPYLQPIYYGTPTLTPNNTISSGATLSPSYITDDFILGSPVTVPIGSESPLSFPIPNVSDDCVENLVISDMDHDDFLNRSEYLEFLKRYNKCELLTTLSIQQETDFQLLAFPCFATEGVDCVLPANAKFSIGGATLPYEKRTLDQTAFLSQICSSSSSNDCAQSPTETPLIVEGLDQCAVDLQKSDTNHDELIDIKEYLTFLRLLSDCTRLDRLDSSHEAIFYSLACDCIKETRDYDCCSPTNARLKIGGANATMETRTANQTEQLSRICNTAKELTSSTGSECDSSPTRAPKGDTCSEKLVVSDSNNDNKLNVDEYLAFIQMQYTDCKDIKGLAFAQWISFMILACFCMTEPGATLECCNSGNPGINIDGSMVTEDERSYQQSKALTRICTVTNATVPLGCRKITVPPSSSSSTTLSNNSSSVIIDASGTSDSTGTGTSTTVHQTTTNTTSRNDEASQTTPLDNSSKSTSSGLSIQLKRMLITGTGAVIAMTVFLSY